MVNSVKFVGSIGVILFCSLTSFAADPSNDDGFMTIFDGKSLDDWEATPATSKAAWSVQDGMIVGDGDKGKGYLTYRRLPHLRDFELRFSYRLPGKGNTGVSIRAIPDPTGKRDFQSYHADLGHVGVGDQVLGAWDFHTPGRKEHRCFRGDRLVIDENDNPTITPIKDGLKVEDIKDRDWNDVRVIANDNHFQFYINDKLASEFTEHLPANRRLHRGMLQLQIHDPGMIVQFKNVRLKVPAAQPRRESPITTFLGEPQLQVSQVFRNERFPNVVVTPRGTVLATWGSQQIRVRRSEDGGTTWGDEIAIGKGIHGGGTTIDEATGDILVFVEDQHPPAPLTIYRSRDDGQTWQAEPAVIHPDTSGKMPSMHMNEHGITLQYGKHKGRLVRPTRYYGQGNRPESLWPTHFTNAIFSDDGGKTWQTSEPFPENGTGEATLAELSDGRIYYNSRRHWAPEGKNPRRRWTAWSDDGGTTWTNASICEILPDGPQNTNYGCMGGLVRLPIQDHDILVYSNCDHPTGRKHGTVWISFDGGKTWPLKRLVEEADFAYSSLTAGRPGTPTEGWIYLHYENKGSKMARFNLSWASGGEATGDGKRPLWINR